MLRKIAYQLSGLLLFAGIILVSSHGPAFPRPNLYGLLVAIAGALLLIKLDARDEARPVPRRD